MHVVPTFFSEKVSEMCIELKNKMRTVNSLGLFPRSGIMRRKSLYVCLKIESWHRGSLLLLKSIVSEVKCKKPTEKK